MPDITISGQDGHFSAYLAKPASGSGPGIVLIQEIFGINKVMRDIADAHASEGYFVLAPDLFWRQEPGVQLTDQTDAEWARARSLMQAFDQDKGIEDLIATMKALRAMQGCTGKVGTVGYCLGGRLAYLMATRSDADCSVSYYGVGIQDFLDEAKNINAPLMLHVAEEDQFVPKQAQATVKTQLQGHPQVTIHSYAGADHAFARVGGKHYDKTAANSANRRTAEFFKQHLS